MDKFSRSVLVVACAQAIFVSSAQSQNQAPSDQTQIAGPVEHVLVTIPLHKEVAETALPFTVLSGEALRRNVATTIGDTLGSLPGVSNASFGPAVGQPVIRGQQGPRVRVLQNGVASADAARASQDHANGVEAMLADSVELLRGPSTLLYGGGAIGGVVNVLDNRIPTTLDSEASGGLEYRHDTASSLDSVVGRYDGSVGNFAFHVDAVVRDFDDLEIPGFASLEVDDHDEEHEEEGHEEEEHEEEEQVPGSIPNTGGDAQSFTFGTSYHFDKGFAGFSVSHLENEYGLPEGAHGHEDEHGEEDHDDEEGEEHDEEHEGEEEEGGIVLDMEQTRYDAVVHLHGAIPGIEVTRAFLTYTDYEHAEIEGSGEIGTLYGNESWQGRLELVHNNVSGFDGVFGVQFASGEFSAIGEEAFIPVTDYSEFGLFVVEDYHFDDVLVEVGLRYDNEERDPQGGANKQSFDSLSASGSALWQISAPWQLAVAVSRAERAPSIEELYSNVGNDMDSLVLHAATGAFEVGNVNLDTETSQNFDVSLRWADNGHYVSVQAYYNDFSDYINLVNTGVELDEDPVRAYVQEDAEFVGLELDSEFALGEFAGGALTLGLFGDVTHGELDDGSDVPRLPPLRVGARLEWSGERFAVWSRVLDAQDQDRPGDNETETAGFTRWDAGADYVLPVSGSEIRFFLALNNITDEEIRLSTSFLKDVAPEAGMGVEAGLRLSF